MSMGSFKVAIQSQVERPLKGPESILKASSGVKLFSRSFQG